jgi:peptidyl-prolyl cis-trans isomerase D
MMIGKFHKLIKSRILWAVFLVVIVFSFVIWGMQVPNSDSDSDQAGTAPGKLNGKEVPREEFQSAYTHVYAGMVLLYGRDIPQTREIRETLEKRAWQRLAALRLAGQMGLRASDGEVVAAIRGIPVFQDNGVFSVARYEAVVRGLLGEVGLSTQFFEEHIRQEIALQRLEGLSNASFLVPPMDVDHMVAALTDRLTLDVVHLKPELVEGQVQMTDEKIQAYFEENAESYRIPRQVRIRAVRFEARPDAIDLQDPAEADYEDYYADHPEEFQAETEAGKPARVLTFEEAKPKMLERMRLAAARARALRDAERFADHVAPILSETEPLSFEEAAKEMKVKPADYGPFAATADPEAAGVPLSVLRAAFELDPEEKVSGAIADGDDTVVLAVTERIPARLPELREVRDAVVRDARAAALREALAGRANAIIARARVAGLRSVAEAGKLDCLKIEDISLSNANDRKDLPFPARGLLRGMVPLKNQDVAEPFPDGKDGLLVAQNLSRTPASEADIAALRPEVEEALKRERCRLAYEDLSAYLVRPEVFTNLKPLPEAESEEDEEPAGDEE